MQRASSFTTTLMNNTKWFYRRDGPLSGWYFIKGSPAPLSDSRCKELWHDQIPPLVLCDGGPLQLVGNVSENLGSIVGKVQIPHFLCRHGYDGECFLVFFDLGAPNLFRLELLNQSWLGSCQFVDILEFFRTHSRLHFKKSMYLHVVLSSQSLAYH